MEEDKTDADTEVLAEADRNSAEAGRGGRGLRSAVCRQSLP